MEKHHVCVPAEKRVHFLYFFAYAFRMRTFFYPVFRLLSLDALLDLPVYFYFFLAHAAIFSPHVFRE